MQYKVTKIDKEYDCGDIDITTDMWYEFLKEPKAAQYMDALVTFLRESDHKSSCYLVGKKYDEDPKHFNAKIWNFGKWVNSQLNDFSMIGADGKQTYWAIPMRYGWETKDGFVWQLRDGLVEALQRLLLEQLIEDLRKGVGLPVSDETYKWGLVQKCDGKSNLDIAKALKGQNIIDNAHVDGVLKFLWESNADSFAKCISNLLDERISLNARIAQYKEMMRSLCPKEWNNCANDERTAAAFLTCKFPQAYTFYKDEVYGIICNYFGIEKRKSAGVKYEHFLQIINAITEKYGDGVQNIVSKYIESFSLKPKNLAVQTLFWCLKDEMKKHKLVNTEDDIVMKELETQKYIELLKANHNIILNGAPGTGKTYLAKKIAEEMGAKVKMVQFHPSYDYTDFVEGLRPVKGDKGNIGFERKDGVFKEFCKEAVADEKQKFVFIIDEINRGEVSKIFGELFFSIDPGYRGEEVKVQTQYQNLVEDGDVFKDGFFVPENVYIIGTMNDIDRSVESMDFAMRRRFAWHEVTAEESAKNMKLNEELTLRMTRLNEVISNTEGLGSAYHVGGSFFLKVQKGGMTVDSLWNLNLKSLMKEYLRGLPNADDTLEKMENAYFLKDNNDAEVSQTNE